MIETTFKVEPKSRNDLRETARVIREKLKIKTLFFPIVELLDSLTILDPTFNYAVEEDCEFAPGEHAYWEPVERTMHIRESVYNGAYEGKGRDRMTIAHEVGHYILHTDQYPKMCRAISPRSIRAFESSEWQAKAFAAELLIPADIIDSSCSPEEIAEQCGVSLEAAIFQLKHIK